MRDYNISEYLKKTLSLTPMRVKRGISHNGKLFAKREVFFKLKEHVDCFLEDGSDNRLIIMPGLRGTGKTTLLYQLYDYLSVECNIGQNQILYLNLDRLKDFEDFNI